jgi:Ca2+-binding RTX toxin-like protein
MVDIAANTTSTTTFEGSPAVLATFSGRLETFGDKDWIRVTLQQGGTYRFYGSVESAGMKSGDSRIALFDAAGGFIDVNDDRPAGGSNSMILFTAPVTGTYFLQIEAVDGPVADYNVFVTIDLSETALSANNDSSTGSGSNLVTGYFGDDFIDFSANAAGIFAFGEQGDDFILGNANNNRFSGGLGNDRLAGDAGDDRLFGDAGLDSLSGNADNDLLYGGPGGDDLGGDDGNDTIFGGADVDLMSGGDGNDEFHVDDAGDRAIELVGEGTDVVFTSVSYTLVSGSEIEFVETENPLSTTALNLAGNAFSNSLTGNNGANVLDGGAGLDVLSGLLGNDTYVLADGNDNVIDSGGIDLATSTITRSLLSAGLTTIENLTLLGAASVSGTGNNLANAIAGNNGANALSGGIGNDVLRGFGGADTLTGGTGIDNLTGGAQSDFFVLNAPLNSANRDVIADFANIAGNNDTFRLENAVMTQLGAAGGLAANKFFAGTAAHDADDRIVYNRTSGAVFYDSNGVAAGGSTLIAVITNKPVLTFADFVVI